MLKTPISTNRYYWVVIQACAAIHCVINKEIAQFKKRMLDLVAADNDKATRVHQVNLSFFPVSKRIKEA